jgi:outer membrane lipoprotein SlyB
LADKIIVLRPGTTNRQVEVFVQTSDTEGTGMGAAMGGTVGGAIGAGAGASLGAAVVSLFVPGVGPIVAAGILGAALLGTGGALAGAQAGSLLEEGLAHGLSHDELFVYQDALRNGHSVVIVVADDSETTERVHDALSRAGAESIDAARESWWVCLRVRRKSRTTIALTPVSNRTRLLIVRDAKQR